jgi:hypothetical protein
MRGRGGTAYQIGRTREAAQGTGLRSEDGFARRLGEVGAKEVEIGAVLRERSRRHGGGGVRSGARKERGGAAARSRGDAAAGGEQRWWWWFTLPLRANEDEDFTETPTCGRAARDK